MPSYSFITHHHNKTLQLLNDDNYSKPTNFDTLSNCPWNTGPLQAKSSSDK